MIDFHTHWIPSGLPDLAARSSTCRWPVLDQPDWIVDSLDRAEAARVREGTASALLSLR